MADQFDSYAQSKLALTMWTFAMAQTLRHAGPVLIALNPGSLLASKMVREGFGIAGKSLTIGANIIVKAALADEFAAASGRYFDNDSERFAAPHRDALDAAKCKAVVATLEATLQRLLTV
ncbi:hypothetical protein QCD60_22580 [Pokkaliibacter sp. MBI-7]|uniref:hypothetical protein n=1 Tax=Pokkaliibacter sp. MBI-7 TaxID=3040600 RepID=UPI00244C5C97|nr:hypothetical protein [Pokkaliibacter sp. MBI-7]MDH2435314.1 hypothetical protein [Pokkaliibacter sp. MBI-7]